MYCVMFCTDLHGIWEQFSTCASAPRHDGLLQLAGLNSVNDLILEATAYDGEESKNAKMRKMLSKMLS